MRMPAGRAALVCLLLAAGVSLSTLSASAASVVTDDDLDDAWGSETFSSSASKAEQQSSGVFQEPALQNKAAPKAAEAKKVVQATLRPIKEVLLELHPKDYFMELGIVAALILYIVNIFVGSQANKKIADKWCMAFGINNGILAQQFSFVGIGKEEEGRMDLLKQGASKFKYYASGRRFVDGALVTLDMRPRQDIIMGYLVNALHPQDDIIDFEIHMREDAMPQTVLAIATARLAREMLRRDDCYEDLKLYARKVEVTRDEIPSWPHEKLTVLAEQASIFYDLMTPELAEQVFGKEAFAKVGKYFRALRFTCEGEGKHKQVAQFSFNLPAAEHMGELLPWMQAAMHMLDLLGSYKLKPEQKAKALKARQDVVAETTKDDDEELLKKREEREAAKRKEEKDKLKRMNPADREKYLAKKEKLERERRARKMGKTLR